jgi:predicted DNA-binding protein (UPF0251 family)
MARPTKWRKVCCLPESTLFGPINNTNIDNEIIMAVEEYETIRLIDFEGLTQEECSDRMKVARTTVQRIYSDARKKLAAALVNGSVLRIEGGDYKLYDESEKVYGCGRCRRRRQGRGLGPGLGQGLGRGLGQGRGPGRGQGLSRGRGQD